MKNAFTTCFASTGFSGVFWSLATCHWDWRWWKYDVRVTAFSASSISGCVIEVSLAKGIWTIYKAHGGLPLSPYRAAVVKDEKPFLFRYFIYFSKQANVTSQFWLKWLFSICILCIISQTLSKRGFKKASWLLSWKSSGISAVRYSTFCSGTARAPWEPGQPTVLPVPAVSITINCLWTAPIITSIIYRPAHLMGFFAGSNFSVDGQQIMTAGSVPREYREGVWM